MNNIQSRIGNSLLLIFCITFSGCIPHLLSNKTEDVTNDPAWWGQYAKNEIIRLKQDALLDGMSVTLNAVRATGPNGEKENISVETLKANSEKYSNLLGLYLLSKGVRLQCIKLERFYTIETQVYVVHVEVLDGELKGKEAILNGRLVTGNPDIKGSLRLSQRCFEPEQ